MYAETVYQYRRTNNNTNSWLFVFKTSKGVVIRAMYLWMNYEEGHWVAQMLHKTEFEYHEDGIINGSWKPDDTNLTISLASAVLVGDKSQWEV